MNEVKNYCFNERFQRSTVIFGHGEGEVERELSKKSHVLFVSAEKKDLWL